MLLEHDGDFVLSYNNCETVRDWYSDFELFYPEWHYSMDVGEKRIGSNRIQRVGKEQTEEARQLQQQIDTLTGRKFIVTEEHAKELEQKLVPLRTAKHDILKKESHELLIVKRS